MSSPFDAELYRALFQDSTDAVLLIENRRFTSCNQAAVKLLGLQNENDVYQHSICDFSPVFQPDGMASEAKARILFDEAIRNGSQRSEWVYQRSDGSLIPLEVVLTAIRVGGKIVLHSVWRDMTTHKRVADELTSYHTQLELLVEERTAELELARSRVEAILNNSVDGIVLMATDGRIVQSNFAFNQLFACMPDEYFGMPLESLAHPDDAAHLSQIIREVNESKAGKRLDMRALRKDGLVVDTEFGIGFITTGSESGDRLVCSIRDMAEHKKAEKALSASEERYRSVVNQVKEVIFQTDAQGLWSFLNPAWSEVTGYAVDSSIGQPCLDYVHPDDRERNTRLFEPLIRREKSYCRHEVRYLTRDSGFRWIEVFARLTLNEQDEIVGTSGTLMDITERKLAEQALLQTLERERELGELKMRFVAMVSHEFRTPLATIQASTDTLRYYLAKLEPAQITARFNKIQAQVKHMTELIEDVLAFDSLNSTYGEFSPVETCIDELCWDIIEDLRVLDRHQQIVFSSADPSLTGKIDPKLLRQILTNLLSNAIKYSPAKAPIRFDVFRDGDSITFILADRGIGIPEADQTHIFDAFYRATNVGNISGTGLGLVVTKHAVELHGGRITFESEQDVGTRFIVTIPMEQPERVSYEQDISH